MSSKGVWFGYGGFVGPRATSGLQVFWGVWHRPLRFATLVNAPRHRRPLAAEPKTATPVAAKESRDLPSFRSTRLYGTRAYRIEVLAPLLIFALVVIFGISTSSLNIYSLREDPDIKHGLTIGEPRPIRTDEWLTWTPNDLYALATGQPGHSPLSQKRDFLHQISGGGVFETVLFFDANLLRMGPWLPDAQLYAAKHAIPFLFVALFVPPLFRRFGASRQMSWFLVVLVILAPASAWWSFLPLQPIAWTSTGCYLLILAKERFERRSPRVAVVLLLLSALFLARIPTTYQPWALTLSLPLLAGTVIFLVWERRGRWVALLSVAVAGALAVALVGAVMIENWDALSSVVHTTYPGRRRSSGTAMSLAQLFGGPALFALQAQQSPTSSNQSELSSAFLVCAVWAMILWPGRHMKAPGRERAVLIVLAGSTALWMGWSMMNWGRFGSWLPILNLVPAYRAAQTVGYLATFTLALVLSQQVEEPKRQAGVAALACVLVTGLGASSLQTFTPWLSSKGILAAVVVTGGLVWLMTRWPKSWGSVAVVAAAAILNVGLVNPVQFGLGELRNSNAAKTAWALAEKVRKDNGFVITDEPGVSALLVANGVPTLSGYQVMGPNRGMWRQLDPDGRYETAWNRGVSYIMIRSYPTPGPNPVVIESPNPDMITVHADPCSLTRDPLRVRYVVTSQQLKQPCASQEGQFVWGGRPVTIFRVRPS